MHGREGEGRCSRWHMWSVPAQAEAAVPSSATLLASASYSNQDFFLKDGRKIHVGDCALFQSGNSPAFIGIIRWFSSSENSYLKLGVNWLYRPADVKLAKGILLEAAPNEVFYSFHKDEILAQSLLHPCKVAFLRKGVELPSGTLSFVCRRVYDIANKCLWWLTDQDYIDERQEEVDKLLDKTQLEMHAAVQSGGRSPKTLNGPSSVQQFKPGSDGIQTSSTSSSLHGKGKRREKVEQGSDIIKKDHVPKVDNGDSGNCMLEGKLKTEVANVTDKGALISAEGVERLVHLMQSDRTEKKIDLAGRILLADVIASTENGDCLGQFVHLRGVVVLDDWLQEAHKGKIGDGNGPKETDKSVEDLLLALLRALDKLPINLHALQTSNIGKSVNNLRSHKNTEIQKKARSLVDTWKKRVDSEMLKSNIVKSIGPGQAIAWSGKPGFSEVCQGGNRHSLSTDSVIKSSVAQPSTCKAIPTKANDFIMKSPVVPTGASKLPSSGSSSEPTLLKDAHHKMAGASGTSEVQMSTAREEKSVKEERPIKEEKSSGSSQSQNNSQSCSSGQAKTSEIPLKEDAKISASGSMKTNKASSGVSRHRKSNNGFHGHCGSITRKEATSSKSNSFNRNTPSSKASQHVLTFERSVDHPISDHTNGHRLRVRLPNPACSPSRSTSGGSSEEPSNIGSRASSPSAPEKHEQNDIKMEGKSGACQPTIAVGPNAESLPNNDTKGELISLGDQLPTSEVKKISNENDKVENDSKVVSTSLENGKEHSSTDSKLGKCCDPSFSSMNALIESCAKYSESGASLLAGDEVGMNLLASVATGELCKPELVTTDVSPKTGSPFPEETPVAIDTRSRVPSGQNDDAGSEKHVACFSLHNEAHKTDSQTTSSPPIHGNCSTLMQENKSTGEVKEMGKNLNDRPDEGPIGDHGSACRTHDKDDMDIDRASKVHDRVEPDGQSNDGLDGEHGSLNASAVCAHEKITEVRRSSSSFTCGSLGDDDDKTHATLGRVPEEKQVEKVQLCSSDMDVDKKGVLNDESKTTAVIKEQLPIDVAVRPESIGSEDAASASGPSNANSEIAKNLIPITTDMGTMKDSKPSDRCKDEQVDPTNPVSHHVGLASCSANENSRISEVTKSLIPASVSREDMIDIPVHESQQCMNQSNIRLPGQEPDKMEVSASPANACFTSKLKPDIAVKCGDFDLNERITNDETNQGESSIMSQMKCLPVVSSPALTPFMVSPMSSSSPIPVTIVAPAKGPFIPPDNLYVCKGEHGWKGSAATSAFRPAEPRKGFEMLLGTSEAPAVTASKQIQQTFEFDLNVPDEENSEDVAPLSSHQDIACASATVSTHDAPTRNPTRLDLDLNKADEIVENGQLLASTSSGPEAAFPPVKSTSEGFSNVDSNVSRDFDLNSGPELDEVGVERISCNQQSKRSVPSSTPVNSLGINNAELGNLSPWFVPSNSYSSITIPSFVSERGGQPCPMASNGAQRFLGSVSANFGSDIYRSHMLSSSPPTAFPPLSFPYSSFPFGSSFAPPPTSFSLGSALYVDSSSCFPNITSQLGGSANAATSPYLRPNVINIQECSTSGGGSESSRKWGKQNLDLNSGPGNTDIEVRDEKLIPSTRQLPVASPHTFDERQVTMYQLAGAGLKRKEPEGGWEAERYAHRQQSFQ